MNAHIIAFFPGTWYDFNIKCVEEDSLCFH